MSELLLPTSDWYLWAGSLAEFHDFSSLGRVLHPTPPRRRGLRMRVVLRQGYQAYVQGNDFSLSFLFLSLFPFSIFIYFQLIYNIEPTHTAIGPIIVLQDERSMSNY